MSCALTEMETIIRFDEADDTAYICTSAARVLKQFSKAGQKPLKSDVLDGKEVTWYFEIPKSLVLIELNNITINVGGRAKAKPGPS